MKKLTLLLAGVFGIALQSLAHGYGHAPINSYADAFVFDEMGVTFSVYPDGEFDFYMDGLNHTSTVSNGYVDVTFNSGYNYNPYVQYDDFGAVIQVENVPIYYDYYGRVSQVGDVLINYRNRRVCQVGGLQVYYNRHGHYAYHTGFINVWNPYFVYRPFYVAFARPAINLCFVRINPYRQYYRPVRYTYYRPYVTNVRPCYATAGTVYRPRSGYGQVHTRYTQAPRRNERPVTRERRKITTQSVASRQSVSNRNRQSAQRGNNYARSTNGVKPANSRTTNRSTQRVNTRSSKPNVTSARTGTRTVQSGNRGNVGNRTVSARSNAGSKPSSTVNRTVKPRSTGSSVQTRSSNSNSRSRVVKPSSSSRSTAQKPTSTRRSTVNSGSRSVKPSSSSRSTVSKPRTSSRSTGSVSRGSSKASVSKGTSSSSKSGGKVSVGNRSSKRGR